MERFEKFIRAITVTILLWLIGLLLVASYVSIVASINDMLVAKAWDQSRKFD